MKKLFCLLLAMLMILPMVVACSNKTDDAVTTPADTTVAQAVTEDPDAGTTVPKIEANLSNEKFEGYEFVIGNDFADATKYTTNAIIADAMNGEPINDAIYNRTELMQEKYGIKIVDMDVDLTPIKNTIKAGEDAYAIITVDLSNVMSVVTEGLALDFNDITTVDLEKPWWDQNAAQKLAYKGKLFYHFSDMLITGLDNARATYFNKDLITDLSLENPYELVNSGKWTYTKMAEMAKVAVSDINGDGTITIADRVGIANVATTFYEGMLTGVDAEVVKMGDDGVPYFYALEQKDAFINIYQKLLSAFTQDNNYLITNLNDGRNMFISGNTLFTVDTLYMASKSRQSDVNFGILPVAKWDEAQEKYWNVSPNAHAMVIPSTTQDTERTGSLLEAFSYYSSAYYSDTALIPSYYETALKYKSSTDTESAEMLDIIHDSISYINKFYGTSLTNAIFESGFAKGVTDITSLLKVQEKAQTKLAQQTIDKVEKLG